MAHKPQFSDTQVEIAQIAKALSHPARVFIMERLLSSNFCSGKSCCTSGEMINDIPIARSTLSQHLKELKLAGLIQGEIELPTIKYCVNTENWERAKQVLENFIKSE